jgi:hypothetical protein
MVLGKRGDGIGDGRGTVGGGGGAVEGSRERISARPVFR